MTEQSLQLSHSVALHISLPCQLDEVRHAASRLTDFLREQGLGIEEVQACELAAVEACNNAVQYAGEGRGEEPISLDVHCAQEAIELRIGDHTSGFIWPDEITLPAADKERGRGLFLINSLMDEIGYFRGKEANCLVLRKRRQEPQKALVAPVLQHLAHQLRESEQIISDMAEELSFCYESLSAIFRCSAELGRTHAFKEFSERLLSDLAQITSADWFILRLASREGNKLSVLTASEAKLKLPALELTSAPESLSLEVKAALSRQDLWFEGNGSFEEGDPLNALASG